MGTYKSNYVKTHDPAGYPLAESEDVISGTESAYVEVDRMKGVKEFIYDLPVEGEEVKSEAQERKDTPVYSGVLKYFPNALKEVSKCSLAGQKQHNQGDELYWDKTKSFDNEDALVRHLIDHSVDPMDTDGVLHLSKCAWRALAALEIYLEKK